MVHSLYPVRKHTNPIGHKLCPKKNVTKYVQVDYETILYIITLHAPLRMFY